jgi:hypothetical protein
MQILADRLRYYEAVLQENGIDPSKLQDTASFNMQSSSSQKMNVDSTRLQSYKSPSMELGSRQVVNKAQVVQSPGRFKIIDK